ncbi:helix-turn-helix transcriptional regulator [unidentified bacterial endosymbiont]|jgi:DNA-binding XRE family transcriptional regulator|uniref:helix-turn-helix transcriptional regulator n=1 Tax=unidentified bacterial endosymbiont TaxID=2355 RepID=UPI00209CC6A6|nr:helix-turn-helix transcriptional regulator [unidentified bacterial endosymbiont]
MKTPEKKTTELQRTVERLRRMGDRQNHATNHLAVKRDNAFPQIKRQRVSPGLNRVGTLERQSVLHAAIRDILLGNITQGAALKKLRVGVLGLKQDEYAKLVNVSRKTLSDVENDKGNYSTDVINKIFKPFGLQTGLVPLSKTLLVSLLA